MHQKWLLLFTTLFSLSLFSETPPSSALKVTCSAFTDGGMIPQKYTCNGRNVNPPLVVENVPEGAKTLVLIVDDPDAANGTWNHWLVWNMDRKTSKIEEDSVPSNAVQGANDFKKTQYGGPCPPSGTHRYFFRVYALDVVLELAGGSGRSSLDDSMKGHILSQGELMGKYSR